MDLSDPSKAVLPSVRGAVLRVLARTDVPMSGRAVAATAGQQVGYRRVSQVLGELVEAGIVLRESQPPAYLYQLNRDHVAAEPVLMLADLRGRLLERIAETVRRWEAAPDALWLFGSAARGDGSSSSDIDLLVLRSSAMSGDDPTWRQQLDELAEHVSKWSGNDCQILEYSSSELAELVHAGDPLIDELRRDSIAVVGRRPQEALRVTRRRR
jgi:predicted nucleotidyltransferase